MKFDDFQTKKMQMVGKFLDKTNFLEEFSRLCEDHFDEYTGEVENSSGQTLKKDLPIAYKQSLQSFVDECFDAVRHWI